MPYGAQDVHTKNNLGRHAWVVMSSKAAKTTKNEAPDESIGNGVMIEPERESLVPKIHGADQGPS